MFVLETKGSFVTKFNVLSLKFRFRFRIYFYVSFSICCIKIYITSFFHHWSLNRSLKLHMKKNKMKKHILFKQPNAHFKKISWKCWPKFCFLYSVTFVRHKNTVNASDSPLKGELLNVRQVLSKLSTLTAQKRTRWPLVARFNRSKKFLFPRRLTRRKMKSRGHAIFTVNFAKN